MTTSSQSRFFGCLLGGAVGDALGAPVEFFSLPEIRRVFGPDGVTGMEPAYGRRGAITGNLLGCLWGAEAIPPEWLLQLEAREVIERLARDLHRCLRFDGMDGLEDYPPY